MSTTPVSQPNLATNESHSQEQLTVDASKGPKLAKALVRQIVDVRAAGFEDELLVDGEVWTVRVHRKARVS